MSEGKVFNIEDVMKHDKESDCWLIIETNGEDKVYDVTKYLSDHPGGPEIMLEFAGKDATEMFEDIGHSNEARKKMSEYLIGSVKGGDKTSKSSNKKKQAIEVKSKGGLNPLAIFALIVAIAVGIYFSQIKN